MLRQEKFSAPASSEKATASDLLRHKSLLLQSISRFAIPEAAAEQILETVLLDYRLRAATVRQPDVWLAANVRRRCLAYLRDDRRVALASKVHKHATAVVRGTSA